MMAPASRDVRAGVAIDAASVDAVVMRTLQQGQAGRGPQSCGLLLLAKRCRGFLAAGVMFSLAAHAFLSNKRRKNKRPVLT